MLLLIDNFDSFTYNIAQYFGQLGIEPKVIRNNKISAEVALALDPRWVVISPGPCSPTQAGVSLELIGAFAGKKPILGVCLGHQCIGQYFGGKVVRADRLMHGKTSPIHHSAEGLFARLPSPFEATRYHSLIVERSPLPDDLEVIAQTDAEEIMGLRHKQLPIWGVQFHPESIATQDGIKLLENFLSLEKIG